MVGGGGGGEGGASSKLKRAARKIVQTCGSFSRGHRPHGAHLASQMSGSPTNLHLKPRISATAGEGVSGSEAISSTTVTKDPSSEGFLY
ncbi:hypothetical protein U1Q18_008702 [Sarracenia purpurea var. burkii]